MKVGQGEGLFLPSVRLDLWHLGIVQLPHPRAALPTSTRPRPAATPCSPATPRPRLRVFYEYSTLVFTAVLSSLILSFYDRYDAGNIISKIGLVWYRQYQNSYISKFFFVTENSELCMGVTNILIV